MNQLKSWIYPPDKPQPKKIAIEGLIGVGKSTLARQLGNLLNYKVFYEPVQNNDLLYLFYKNPKKYAFAFQVHMLTIRCSMDRAGTYMIESGIVPGIVYDRTLAGDTCFAEVNTKLGNISFEEYQVYLNLYNLMKYNSPYPDVIIYLSADIDTIMRRIQQRDRSIERNVSYSYLELLQESYERFIEAIKNYTCVITILWNEYLDVKSLWNQVLQQYYQTEHSRFRKVLLKH